MPFTPFHYPVTYFIYKVMKYNKKTSDAMNLPALIIGSMIPDLGGLFEIITLNTFYRIVTHSLIGAVTIGTALSFFVTVFFYPTFVNLFFKIDKQLLTEKCRFSLPVFFSSSIGAISHNLLDVLNHDLNPLLWPWITYIPSPISFLFGGIGMTSGVIHILLLIFGILILIKNKEKMGESLLLE
ncbi:MAG: DUF4184 family protein [Candidatus Ranarchaeia archaeon]